MFGSLRVVIGDNVVRITSPRERAVFAGLAMRAGEPVSHDHLCQAVWDRDWSSALDGAYRPAVSRLRRSLGDKGLVVRESFGYRLAMDPDDIDVLAFQSLARTYAAATSPAEWRRALGPLTRAAALWRGAPFADIPSEHLRRAHGRRLEAQLSRVRARRAEAVIRTSAPRAAAEVLEDLESLIRDRPEDEHLRWLVMLASHRSGRNTGALAAFRDAERYCAKTRGARTGKELKDLGDRILRADPSLLRTPFGG